MYLARLDGPWRAVSREHLRIRAKIAAAVECYAESIAPLGAYVITGTFGGGKTTELFAGISDTQRHRILPMYITADSLFAGAFAISERPTPEKVAGMAEEKLIAYRAAICAGDEAAALAVIDPHGVIHDDIPRLVRGLVQQFGGQEATSVKTAVFVDELEGVYQRLQSVCDDSNPLRPWLEKRTALKFIAVAPAGMYEMGGADRARVTRLNIPPVDMEYLRQTLVPDAGRANAVWWLSRGKVRHLLNAIDILREREHQLHDAQAVRHLIEHDLSPIGQPPVQVPAAYCSALDNLTKIPYLANLQPVCDGPEASRFVVPVATLDVAVVAEELAVRLGLNRDIAMLVARYFVETLRNVSDAAEVAYIEETDISEFFQLALDHLLEYEYGLQPLEGDLGAVLALYERTAPGQEGGRELLFLMGRYRQRIATYFPLSARELRHIFPFPTMSPILHASPSEVQERWERHNQPLWRWTDGNTLYLLFINKAAFAQYTQSEAFLDDVLPDGRGACCLFTPGEQPTVCTPIVEWLRENGKVRLLELNALVSNFLLSLAGELRQIPGNLNSTLLETQQQHAGNQMVLRKIPLYRSALHDAVSGAVPTPVLFCSYPTEQLRQDARTIWGAGHITNAHVAVSGLMLAFSQLSDDNRRLLADLRELFRSPRGLLRRNLKRTGGFLTLVDDFLPSHDAANPGTVVNSAKVVRVSEIWGTEAEQALHRLAYLLSQADFVKLAPERDDFARVFEAFWRARRDQHDSIDLAGIRQKIVSAVAVLKEARQLHDRLREELNIGIEFGEMEDRVQALVGFEQLVQVLTELIGLGTRLDGTTKRLGSVLLDALELGNYTAFQSDVRRAASALSSRAHRLEVLRRNLTSGSPRTVQLGALTEETLQTFLREDLVITENDMTLQDLTHRMEQQSGRVETVVQGLNEVERDLTQFTNILTEIRRDAGENVG